MNGEAERDDRNWAVYRACAETDTGGQWQGRWCYEVRQAERQAAIWIADAEKGIDAAWIEAAQLSNVRVLSDQAGTLRVT